MSNTLFALIVKYALLFNVPVMDALAIAKLESNFDQSYIGKAGEIGIYQIRPEYYPKENLHNLETNVKIGLKHLAFMKRYCKHEEYLVCYNVGVEGARYFKYPSKHRYWRKYLKIKEQLENELY